MISKSGIRERISGALISVEGVGSTSTRLISRFSCKAVANAVAHTPPEPEPKMIKRLIWRDCSALIAALPRLVIRSFLSEVWTLAPDVSSGAFVAGVVSTTVASVGSEGGAVAAVSVSCSGLSGLGVCAFMGLSAGNVLLGKSG